MMKGTFLRLAAVTALALGLAAGPAPAAQASDDALIRAAHFSPDTPGVDVYLNGFSGGQARLWVPDAMYGGVSPYERVTGWTVCGRNAPARAAASSTPVISWNLNVKAGQAYTTAAIGAKPSCGRSCCTTI